MVRQLQQIEPSLVDNKKMLDQEMEKMDHELREIEDEGRKMPQIDLLSLHLASEMNEEMRSKKRSWWQMAGVGLGGLVVGVCV